MDSKIARSFSTGGNTAAGVAERYRSLINEPDGEAAVSGVT